MTEEKPDYDIFEETEVYETLIHTVEKDYINEATATFCDNIAFPDEYKNQVRVLCRKFVSFFNNLKSNSKFDSSSQAYQKYPQYLNFWIRLQLELQNISKNDMPLLYKHLNGNYEKFDEDRKLQDKLYIINDDDFTSMYMLYQLYKIYNGSLSDYNIECNEFYQLFKENYDKCLYKCYAKGDSKLCDVMKNFKKLYDKEKFPRLNNCKKKLCPLLPELSEYKIIYRSHSENDNIGYQLVQTADNYIRYELPKLTGENNNELKELIWLQYNMPFHYNEEMMKTYMMSVLYQFIVYCNENKKNLKLSLFMKEFIGEYYKKNKTEYQKIFSECKNDPNTQKYCQLHKKCNDEFEQDLSIIKDDSSKYI
ncbi:hypothetical protein PVIIG_05801 [Plasmodium vivax India VII]|uniref:Uncharacterized protein n=1 Tax=Plasmodium vivax India VII TaxID=1077284 RepID=A0A0J9S2F9_PLAVI|nr:hypothetical protein PVIIG_05801 [Plasmodium vivax India VII]